MSFLERGYPRTIEGLATHIEQPKFPSLLWRFLYERVHPDAEVSSADVDLEDCPFFGGSIYVFHSAIARFYAPSNLCGAGGMYRERIHSNPNWHGEYARRDTMFVEINVELEGMQGMAIARAILFFSFTFRDENLPCALVRDGKVRFRTVVRTRTWPNQTMVRSKVRGLGRTGPSVRFSVRDGPIFCEPILNRSGPNWT